ncbi:MAG TPA: hypothetical protein PLJ97_02335 [Candidatus Saccharibacteria bacterium]|nr:hypothetical protein [Candidatus Saccharibacteria bacterium]
MGFPASLVAGIGDFWLRSGSVVSSAPNREAQANQVARIQNSSYCKLGNLGTNVPTSYLGICRFPSFYFLGNPTIAQVEAGRYGVGLSESPTPV